MDRGWGEKLKKCPPAGTGTKFSFPSNILLISSALEIAAIPASAVGIPNPNYEIRAISAPSVLHTHRYNRDPQQYGCVQDGRD